MESNGESVFANPEALRREGEEIRLALEDASIRYEEWLKTINAAGSGMRTHVTELDVAILQVGSTIEHLSTHWI